MVNFKKSFQPSRWKKTGVCQKHRFSPKKTAKKQFSKKKQLPALGMPRAGYVKKSGRSSGPPAPPNGGGWVWEQGGGGLGNSPLPPPPFWVGGWSRVLPPVLLGLFLGSQKTLGGVRGSKGPKVGPYTLPPRSLSLWCPRLGIKDRLAPSLELLGIFFCGTKCRGIFFGQKKVKRDLPRKKIYFCIAAPTNLRHVRPN